MLYYFIHTYFKLVFKLFLKIQETNVEKISKSLKRKFESEQSWNLNDAIKAITAEMELPISKKKFKITPKIERGIDSSIKYARISEPCDPR